MGWIFLIALVGAVMSLAAQAAEDRETWKEIGLLALFVLLVITACNELH